MRAYQNFFLIFILVLVVGLLQSYSYFRDYFSDTHDFKRQVDSLSQNLEKEKLKTALAKNQLYDFQNQILNPSGLVAENSQILNNEFQKKQFLDSVRSPSSEALDLSNVALAKGRDEFVNKQYATAAKTFRDVVDKYPTSLSVVEAYFMQAESLYMANRMEESLDVIDKMVVLFPDNEMTGFILLRMGQIFQLRKRSHEAVEVYKAVIDKFPHNEALKLQANKLLKQTDG